MEAASRRPARGFSYTSIATLVLLVLAVVVGVSTLVVVIELDDCMQYSLASYPLIRLGPGRVVLPRLRTCPVCPSPHVGRSPPCAAQWPAQPRGR